MNSGYVKALAIAAWAAWGIVPGPAQAQLVDLGATTGYALNNSGEAALASGIYNNGSVTPLPALPGSTTPATPLAINASGQVAGSAVSPNIVGSDPVAYINGSLIDIGSSILTGTLANGSGRMTGINSSNVVVGTYSEGPPFFDPTSVSFTYDGGTVTDLPTFPCKTFNPDCTVIDEFGPQAFGINDGGEIVGSVEYQTPPVCMVSTDLGLDAFSYINGTWSDFGPGTAYAVNASGQVTGTLTTVVVPPGDDICQVLGTIAFLYSNGTKISLGTLPGGANSIGYALNATGQVVGSSDFTGSTTTHAFFYNGVMTDLNSLVSSTDPLQPFVTLSSGVAINDSRLILANGVDSRTGATHAYLLQGPGISFAPGVLTFPAEAVGATSPSQPVVVSNSGTSAITLGTIAASANFSIESNNCTASLAPGGQCTVNLAYTPASAGAANGTLKVPSAGVNYSVTLTASAAVAGSIVASSKTALVGQPLTLTWTISAGSTCTASSSSTNTKWSASKPPFTGTVPASGKRSLTETVDGTVTYALQCTAPGTANLNVSTSVVWTYPPVTATVSASATSITAGEAVTLTWSSSNATSCTASGGGQSDGWPGSKATSGSQSVTESFAPTTGSVTLVYTLTCTSSASGLTSQGSAQVAESPAPSNSGGGGGFDLLSLAGLASLLTLRDGLGRIRNGASPRRVKCERPDAGSR